MTPITLRRQQADRTRRMSTADILHLRRSAEVTAAYDAAAPIYDRLVEDDRWMRELLWQHYGQLFEEDDRVLDVGCATGLDTLHLARRGVRMTAIDLSGRMIRELEDEAELQGLTPRIQAQVADAADLVKWPGRYFHGVISTFGVVNTIYDPVGFAADAARLLLPGGRLLVHMLTPASLWERLDKARRKGHRAALEPLLRRKRTVVVCGQLVRNWVVPAGVAYREIFAPYFHLRRRYSLGFLTPRTWLTRRPRHVQRTVGRLETRLGRLSPFIDWGRYYVLELERRGDLI